MPPFDYQTCQFPRGLGTQTVQVSSVLEHGPASRQIQARLKQLAELPENWNGYGSSRIAPSVINTAFAIYSDFAKFGMPPPRTVPVSGGGVQFEWSNSLSVLEVEVRPSGSVEFLVVDSQDESYEGALSDENRFAEITQLASWYVAEKRSLDDLKSYAGSYR